MYKEVHHDVYISCHADRMRRSQRAHYHSTCKQKHRLPYFSLFLCFFFSKQIIILLAATPPRSLQRQFERREGLENTLYQFQFQKKEKSCYFLQKSIVYNYDLIYYRYFQYIGKRKKDCLTHLSQYFLSSNIRLI